MAILRKSSKLEIQDSNIFILKENLPITHVGCFSPLSNNTSGYDLEKKEVKSLEEVPEQKEVKPLEEVPERKPDHWPKDWHDKHRNFEGLVLNRIRLNEEQISEGDTKDAD